MASIISDKYKGKKFEKDWLAALLDTHATKMRTVKLYEPDPADAEKKIQVEKTRPDGVDVDKLFAIAKANEVDTTKLDAVRGTGENGADPHGFAGRSRMTLRNQLQTIAKQRHGLIVGEEFVEAPADWLKAKGAPDTPSHSQTGEKITPPKAAASETPETPEAEEVDENEVEDEADEALDETEEENASADAA
jgi:hypothetical protein